MKESKPRLSCEQCRRRKTKCDKQAPCSSCKAAGLTCEVVQRDRLPRGKSGKTRNKDGVLERRVTRIEELLAQAQDLAARNERKPSATSATSATSGFGDSGVESTKRLNSYVASEFWSILSTEVAGLRETFDETSDEEDSPPDLTAAYNRLDISSDYGTLLFGNSPSSIDTYMAPYPSAELRASLLATYRFRADSIYKVLHWPTVCARLEEANSTHHEGTSAAEQALEFSIYCTAVCSLSGEEAQLMLSVDRTTAVQQYMRATELALARSHLMQRPDMTALLAFVLYVNCVWACGRYATKWTLVAVAVRLGDAMGLGREDPKMFTPFELETRRRLWHGVGILDTHCTYDRGSAPIMTLETLGPVPMAINDADLSPGSTTLVPTDGFNDMAFTLVAIEAGLHHRRTTETEDWDTKLKLVQDYEEFCQRIAATATGDTPIERFNRECAPNIARNMHLLLRRPPYKQSRNVVPESDNFDIMGCAVGVLEGHINEKNGDLGAFEWKDWIPWYALAVVLAELCKSPTGPVADRAWTAAQKLYRIHVRPPSDLESGMLWKPITKLMRRVQRERPDADTNAIGLNFSPATLPAQPPTLPAQGYISQDIANASALGFNPLPDNTGIVPPTMAAQSWPAEMPAWPAIDLTSPSVDANQRNVNTKLYHDLDPANGVSWLDWNMFLDDPTYIMIP